MEGGEEDNIHDWLATIKKDSSRPIDKTANTQTFKGTAVQPRIDEGHVEFGGVGEVLILEDRPVLESESEDRLISLKQLERNKAEEGIRERERLKRKFNPYEDENQGGLAGETKVEGKLDFINAINPAVRNYPRKRPKRIQLNFTDEPMPDHTPAIAAGRPAENVTLDDEDLRIVLEKTRRQATKIKFSEIPTTLVHPSSTASEGIIKGTLFSENTDFVFALPSRVITVAEDAVGAKESNDVPEGDLPQKANANEESPAEGLPTIEPIDEALDGMKPVFEREPLVRRGMCATLQFLSKLGIRPQLAIERAPPKQGGANRFDHIRVEHYDEEGNLLTPKEAYKVLSHRFHGKEPGKGKIAKLQKKKQIADRLAHTSFSDTPLGLASALRETQRLTGSTHIVISHANGNVDNVASNDQLKQVKPAEETKLASVGNKGRTRPKPFLMRPQLSGASANPDQQNSNKPRPKIFGMK